MFELQKKVSSLINLIPKKIQTCTCKGKYVVFPYLFNVIDISIVAGGSKKAKGKGKSTKKGALQPSEEDTEVAGEPMRLRSRRELHHQ